MMRRIQCAALIGMLLFLTNCAALQVAIQHAELDVQTRMSDTIFLDPVSAGQRTVHLVLRNTTDKPINLAGLADNLRAKGYRLVDDPAAAYYVLQVNTLYVGKADPSAAQQTLLSGYGGALLGGYTGAMIGASMAYNPWMGAGWGGLAGGLIGMAVETVANAAVKNVTYTLVTDVQISERTRRPIAQMRSVSLRQGTATHVQQFESGTSRGLLYRTRVVSTANQVNLDFNKALGMLQANLSQSVSGIF